MKPLFAHSLKVLLFALIAAVALSAQDSDPSVSPAAPEPKPAEKPAAPPAEAAPAKKGGKSSPAKADKSSEAGPSDAQLEKLATESEKEAKADDEAEEPKAETRAEKAAKAKADAEKAKAEAKAAKDEKKSAKKDKDKEGGSFRPDFRDQEIQDILKIFSKIIGKNIIADEKVKGKITVISPYKIPRSLAYPYLYSMLAIKGFGIVEENENLIRVVAIKDALAGSPLIYLGREEVKDTAIKSDLPVTQILPVYGGKPSRLSAILKRLTSANTDLVDYDDINMLIITGSLFEVNRLIRIANLIDYQGPPPECDEVKDPDCGKVRVEGSVHVYRLENMQAENVEATLKKVQLPVEPVAPPTAAPGSAPAPAVTQANTQKKPIDVIAHKETNSIIFVGTNDEFELVKSLIKRIDLQRQQVLLEVLIVEVGLDNTNEFGIDWLAGKQGGAQFNSTQIATRSGYITTTGQIDTSRPTTLPGLTLTFVNDSITNILGILNAHIGRSNFLVVSAPQVLTLDNQEAEINVGEDRPVQVNAISTAVGAISQSRSFEYRPVGVKLKFTPQVNKNRMVMLNLFQEVKSITSTDSNSGNPIIGKKDIKTFVRVQDGQTIVIGGLVSNDRRTDMKKVPILGDLPLLGYLFRRQGTTNKRTNLMVFITPHIVTNRAIADKVTEDQRQNQIKEYKRSTID
ncbi:secretin N-terminal domain-containing protein [Turneriella parva]|uniref:Type II secretion system protein D (GspD) n=1 Tax=Turneriella parva (strain ATCC BAA-1111 / DSM 21527 / NCTC 11395 / H) TaxID=869212 RepID=I4BBU7_TURPD|nr:secretin N-terminal domain-containing protein [Turneriella parva]AFM14754.1 type II secretion system protein D (GspD) [Turneriella parva DSM 21527]